MDGRATTMIPEDDRLTQTECFRLFEPMAGDTVWVNRDGVTLIPCRKVRDSDLEAWRAAMVHGDADTVDLEWRVYDHGISRSDVRAQLEVAAQVLDDLGVGVEWDANHLGFGFRYGDGGGGVIDQPLGFQDVGFGPIRLFDIYTGEALSLEHIRLQAAAFLEGVALGLTRSIEATVFAAQHRIDVPAAVLDGMTLRQREWAGDSLRVGASGRRVVAFARDGCVEPHHIYDGPDMDEAVRTILEYAAAMEERQGSSDVAAMSMRGGGARHGAGGMST